MAFWHTYHHYFSQSTSLVNGNFIIDPVNTYAAMGIMQGQGAGEAVLHGIQHGAGLKFRQYYQYATLRYKNRNFDSGFDQVDFISPEDVEPKAIDFIDLLKPTDRIIDIDINYSLGGPAHYKFMQDTYQLDAYNTLHNGMSIAVADPVNMDAISEGSSGKSWIVGYIHADDVPVNNLPPVIILHPEDKENPNVKILVDQFYILDTREYQPVKSAGIAYITSTKAPEVDEIKTLRHTSLLDWKRSFGTPPSVGKKYSYTITTSNPLKETETSAGLHSTVVSGETVQSTREKWLEVVDIGENSQVGYYDIIKTTKITYDKEEFLISYPIDTNEFAARLKSFRGESRTTSKKSKYPISFKFYPYIPVKECWDLQHTGAMNVFDFKDSRLVELTRKNQEDFRGAYGIPEDPSPPAKPNKGNYLKAALKSAGTGGFINLDGDFDWKGVGGNTASKSDAVSGIIKYNQDKEKARAEYDKVLAHHEFLLERGALQSDAPNQRPNAKLGKKTSRMDSARKLKRESERTRKIAINDPIQRKKQHSNAATKRHLEQMAKLLGVDLYGSVASMAANKNENRIKRSYIMPAVNLNTTHNSVVKYWWTFFDRLYSQMEDGGIDEWGHNVRRGNLSLSQISWDCNHQFRGKLAFAFIQKFEMEGTIRKIKRHHDVYEIRRGKPIVKPTLQQLAIEPPKELAKDTYYTSKQGKQYNIGGSPQFFGSGFQVYNPIGLIKENWDYTFICKQIGDNKLSVIAIAGLVGQCDKGYSAHFWGAAWKDLGMEYARQRDKFINNKTEAHPHEYRYKDGKKRIYHRIQTFFQVPVDYNTIRRMGGVDLERFVPRAATIYNWGYDYQRTLASWVAPFIQIVGFIIAVIASIASYNPETGWSIMISVNAIAKAVVTAVVMNLVVRMVIVPLMRALGIKGLLAVIILIVVAVIASYAGGYNPTLSSLPYASQTAGAQVATVATATTASSTAAGITSFITSAVGDISLRAGLMATFNAATQTYMEKVQAETQKYQDMMSKDNVAYTTAMNELEEIRESTMPKFDVQQVMESLRLRFNLKDPNNILTSLVDSSDYAASYDYLKGFLDMKLDLDLERFDPVHSLDFSVKYK